MKPCPFCGSSQHLAFHPINNYVVVCCEKCGATGPHAAIEANAVTLWNLRSKPEFKITWEESPDKFATLSTKTNVVKVRCEYDNVFAEAFLSPAEYPVTNERQNYIEDSLKRNCILRHAGLIE